MLKAFVEANTRVSRRLDQLVPARFRLDGNQDYRNDFVWRYLRPGQTICDVGGGKQPFLTAEQKRELECRVIGVDVSAEELSKAPVGVYDEVIVGDITSYVGRADADVVLCQAVLEHVVNVQAAMSSLASILKPGGVCLLFIPCRNSAFARLNLLLPETVKRRLLFSVFPDTIRTQGFSSYYDRCTPHAVFRLAAGAGLRVAEQRTYYTSSYFSFLFPLHALWRIWTLVVSASRADNMCETFSVALEKPRGGLSSAS